MKKIIRNILILLSMVSCEDILDKSPLDRISENNVWNDELLIQAYVNASYLSIEHGFYQGMLSSACDECYDINNTGSYFYIQRGELTADNISSISSHMNIWKAAYSNIRSMNIFLKNIEASPVSDGSKQKMKGEMKFIRAFVYANLIWRYGGVPLFDDVFELNDDYAATRSSYDDCVDFICDDLDEAISLLPDKQTGSNLGRASADAAKALKSRVLLYSASPLNNPGNDIAKWEKAAAAAETLLNSGYTLNNDYQSTFVTDNNEIIFARYFTQANYHETHKFNGRNGDSGWGGSCPSQNLVDDYEMINGELPYTDASQTTVNPESGYDPANPYVNRDPRFYASILYDGAIWMNRETETFAGGLDSRGSSIASWNATLTGYYFKKFLDESIPPVGSSTQSTSPWIFFRYAEILLNLAEAKFEIGDEVSARNYLNMVRNRTSVNMPEVTATGEALRNRIRHERRIELALENHRFFDVRRWKIAIEAENIDIKKVDITKHGDGTKSYVIGTLLERNFAEKNYLLPIPRTEIDKSGGSLVQNPGYN